MTVLCRFPIKLIFALTIGCIPMASPLHAEDETSDDAEDWQSRREILQFAKPAIGQESYPWLDQVRATVLRALNSPDHARELVNLQAARGTKSASAFAKYVGPLKLSGPSFQDGVEVRLSVMKSVRLYTQKETKGDIFPKSLREGLKFKIGGGSGGSSSAPDTSYVHNGNPEMRYGLRLTDIEPGEGSLKLASNDGDLEYLAYAPKARVVYEIGEVYPDGYARSYPIAPPPPEAPPPSLWESLPKVPDFKFDGRMAPRGLPGPGSPLPPQSIFLDQTQGYYQLEAQMTGNLKQENMLHRLRVPFYGKMNYRQERNKDLIFTKSTFENIVNNDKGFWINLERYHLEKRYQLGFQFHRFINHFELYAHVPDTALSTDSFWRAHRWETKFDFHF